MTDNEIMKALETALKTGDEPIGEHWGCFLTTATVKDALDLINRQKADIHALIGAQETLQKNLAKVIRAEAIKEFAERLKAEGFRHKNLGDLVQFECIDALVKEMTEESDGKL